MASRLESGSSSRKTLGSRTIARASATRCRSPPESSRGLRSRSFPIPNIPAAHSTFFRTASFSTPRARSGKAMFLYTVMWG